MICQALLCKEWKLSWWQWMNYYAALQTVSSSFVLFTSWQAGLRKTARPVRTCVLNMLVSSKAMILFIHMQNRTSRLTACHENSDVDEEEKKNLFVYYLHIISLVLSVINEYLIFTKAFVVFCLILESFFCKISVPFRSFLFIVTTCSQRSWASKACVLFD